MTDQDARDALTRIREIADAEIQRTNQLVTCVACGEVITDQGDDLWLHNWSKSNNCDPEDAEGATAVPA